MSGVMSFIEKQKAISGDPFGKISDEIQLKSDPNGYAKLWKTGSIRKELETSIRKKMEEGKMKQKAINEKMLINEYWIQWIGIDEKDHQTQLLRHPALIENDYMALQHLITNERARQFYWAVGMSIFSYGIYHLSLKKKATFYNFFRKRSSYKIVNYSKNFLGGLALVWTWTLTLSYFFDQKIPTDIAKKGYFKNYKIMFEPVYI